MQGALLNWSMNLHFWIKIKQKLLKPLRLYVFARNQIHTLIQQRHAKKSG